MTDIIDFGASDAIGAHHFYAEIPIAPRDAISIYEDFGFEGDTNQREKTELRALVARELWTKIRDDARRDFNARLKAKKLPVGTWSAGKVKLDRFLGRELCVLAWAAEHATPSECPIICQKWLALRPEERWWLYSKTAAGAAHASDGQRGWRKALYCALSDGTGITVRSQVNPRKKGQRVDPSSDDAPGLFDFIEKGNL